ncbi:MAG: FAD:protein FMN transferase [Ruminococcaceae bacterium]|nr:FAD:protein FMN transferase [Oscillospiraceae bacterium]
MKKLLCILIIIVLITSVFAGCNKSKKQKFTDYSFDYFDTVTTIVGFETNKSEFQAVCSKIKSLLEEYHKLYNIYTRYEKNNLVTVNSSPNKAIEVDEKLIDLLVFSKEMYNLTGGKTNVAMGSVLSIWHTYRQEGLNNLQNAKLPPMDKLKSASEHTDINNLIIDKENSTVSLSDSDMSLDVGAIAKGYAVECVADFLSKQGITGYLLNVGGNVRAIGAKADGSEWLVGIENPDNTEEYLEYLKIKDMSVVTSGRYQRYYTVDGKDYHHIIDPDTLMPAEKYKSVSVIAEDSGMADALSTALFLTELSDGLKLVEKLNVVEAIWVLNDGTVKSSKGFKNYVDYYDK